MMVLVLLGLLCLKNVDFQANFQLIIDENWQSLLKNRLFVTHALSLAILSTIIGFLHLFIGNKFSLMVLYQN